MKVKNNYNLLDMKLIVGFLAMAISFSSFGQDVAYARSMVDKLASPGFKGRGYAGGGAKKASEFIAGEFKKAGLIPLNNGSYFQNFSFSVNTFPGTVFVEIDGTVLQTAADYLIAATSPSVKGKFRIVTANREQIAITQGLEQVTASATDAFILLDNWPGTFETEEQKTAIGKNLARLKNDTTLHFKGLVVSSADKLTWTTLTYQSKRPVVLVNKKDFNPKNAKQINIKVEAKFVPEFVTRNVVGMVKGKLVPDSMLVITAHFDHLGIMGKKVYFPGANDNASGTAMLLSMVKYYGSHPPKYTMVFIGFSGEEIGMLGSQAFVDNPLIDLRKIKFLTNFDMAGTGEEGIRVVNGTIYKKQYDTLVQLNEEFKLLPKVDIRGESCNSDHCRFYQKGVPSIFVYTQGGIQAYHDIYDRPETLPLTEFKDYFTLMQKFFDGM